MLVQLSKKGRKWAVCRTHNPEVSRAMKAELQAAANWYYSAVTEGRIGSEKDDGLAFDENGCVVPQTIKPYWPKCNHRGWGNGRRPILAMCPQCKQIMPPDAVEADREFFRDIANMTRSDAVEHDISVEREFEVARWRALMAPARDGGRLWLNYPGDSHDSWLGPKMHSVRGCKRQLEIVLEQEQEDVLVANWEIRQNRRHWEAFCDARALCHPPGLPRFDDLERRTVSFACFHDGIQRRATYLQLVGNWTGISYVRYFQNEHVRRRGQLQEGEEARPLAAGWSRSKRSKHPPHRAIITVDKFELDPLPYSDRGLQGEIARLKVLGYTFIEIACKKGLQESRLRLWIERWRSGHETADLQLHCLQSARVSTCAAAAGRG